MAEIDVGKVIAGKYELVRLLGKGAMGEVWLATHNSLGGEFAVKLVRPDEDDDATASGRFQLEAQISAKLSRKTRHIVSVSDHGEEDGLAYLVMELLEGESLEAVIAKKRPLDMPEVAALVVQIARALGLAHAEGIFHRDLKPGNVFLSRDEDGRLLVKLLDFGIARARAFGTKSPFATAKDMVLGTPSYMSPEQARGLDTLDYRCDLWGLSVVIYEALANRIPFEGTTVEDIFLHICTHQVIPIRSVRADLPPAVDAFFARAFAPKLEERFATAAELSEAFLAMVDATAVEAALGAPLPPASARRLPVPSDPNIPVAGAQGPGEKAPDPVAMSVTPSGATIRVPKHKSGGWLVAGGAAIAVAVAAIAVVALVRDDEVPSNASTAVSAPPEPDATEAVTAPPTTSTATSAEPTSSVAASDVDAPAPSASTPAPPATGVTRATSPTTTSDEKATRVKSTAAPHAGSKNPEHRTIDKAAVF